MHWTHNQSTHHWLITTSDCLTKQAWTHIAAAAAKIDSPLPWLCLSLPLCLFLPSPLSPFLSLSFPCLNTFHFSPVLFHGSIFTTVTETGNTQQLHGGWSGKSCVCLQRMHFLKRTNVIYVTASQWELMPFVSRRWFSLIAWAGQPKSLVLQREGAVSFIQLFSTSTSMCQGGGKRRLNTLCNSTRPDAVLLRFNVPFFCLCRWKRLAGWGREWTKSRQSQGQGEMKRARETETTAPWPGLCHTTEVSIFKGMLRRRGGNNNRVVDIVFSPGACSSRWGHEIISVLSTCHPLLLWLPT